MGGFALVLGYLVSEDTAAMTTADARSASDTEQLTPDGDLLFGDVVIPAKRIPVPPQEQERKAAPVSASFGAAAQDDPACHDIAEPGIWFPLLQTVGALLGFVFGYLLWSCLCLGIAYVQANGGLLAVLGVRGVCCAVFVPFALVGVVGWWRMRR